MDAQDTLTTNAADLVHRLDPEAIRKRLDELDRERQALLILLRASVRVHVDSRPRRKGGQQ
jgi:hypothetical protein